MKKIFVYFLLVSAAALTAATALPKGVVNADKVNLRLGAGLNHPVVGSLKNGQRVEISKIHGSWLELVVPETLTAYVNEARINSDGTLNGELNMRTKMSTTAPIIGVLPKGAKVKRLDKRANGWVQIVVPAEADVKVYVASFLVNFNAADFNENGNPVYDPEKSAVPDVEKTPEKPAEKPAEKAVEKAPEKAPATVPAVEKAVEKAPAPAEKVELQGVLIKWKYSSSQETAYALLTERDGFNQAFITADDATLLARAENKPVKVSGVSAGRFGKNGAIILKAHTITVL